MRRVLTFAVLALSLLSFRALTQQAPTTGGIEGMVVGSGSGQPIANAQVTLMMAQIGGLPPVGPLAAANATTATGIAPVTTGSDGKFAFKDLKPGTYRVAAAAMGFVRQEYGQRALNGSGRLLFVVAGQSIHDATIRITPSGTVSGRILDQNGQPATGAPVQLLRAVYNAQGKTYGRGGAATVDDRGNYRIFGVTPGLYTLMVGTQAAGIDLAMALRGNVVPTRPVRYSVTYYPNASKLDESAPIEVTAGNESSFDLRSTRETRTFHVRGRVINPTSGPFPQDLGMMLGFSNLAGGGGNAVIPTGFDPATGTFDVPNVPPGEFTIGIARAFAPGRGAAMPEQQAQRAMGFAASVPIHVTNADIDGLVLTLTPGITAQGKLIVEGQQVSAIPNLNQLRLNIRNVPFATGIGTPVSSPIAADGSFQVTALRAGDYRVELSASVPGFYVKSVKYGGEDVLGGRTFKISAGSFGPVEVVLKAGTQTVAGTVTDGQSRPVPGIGVVLIPAQRERLDLFRNTHTDQNGRFTLTDLIPGEYKVFSWDAVDTNAYMAPGFLEPYEQLGNAVSVRESSSSNVDVKLIPAR
jgi:protocatechuate 3,4-dioxygenase beta subunit